MSFVLVDAVELGDAFELTYRIRGSHQRSEESRAFPTEGATWAKTTWHPPQTETVLRPGSLVGRVGEAGRG